MRSLFQLSSPRPEGFRDADPALLSRHLAEATVVDVREPDEFDGDLGHIAGASLVPLSTVPKVAASWERDREIVLVCRSGGRSGYAARQLVAMGFRRVVNLQGGMLAWNAQRLPVARDRAA